jgi:hypothetical protein
MTIIGSGSRQYLAQFSNTKKIYTKSCLFNVRSSIISKKVGLSFLIFLLSITFYVGSGSGSVQAKSYDSYVFRFHNTAWFTHAHISEKNMDDYCTVCW